MTRWAPASMPVGNEASTEPYTAVFAAGSTSFLQMIATGDGMATMKPGAELLGQNYWGRTTGAELTGGTSNAEGSASLSGQCTTTLR